jgi:hypothetical protein
MLSSNPDLSIHCEARAERSTMSPNVTILFVTLMSLIGQTPGFGAVTRWSLSEVTFSDGGTAEGFFDFNSAPGSLGVVENWRITVAGGNEALFPEFTYSPANSTLSRVLVAAWAPEPAIFFTDSASNRGLRITPAAPLTDEGGIVALDLETGGGGIRGNRMLQLRAGPHDHRRIAGRGVGR